MKNPIIIIILCSLFTVASIAQDESPKELFEDGDFFFAREDYDGALEYYNQATEQIPGSDILYYNIEQVFFEIHLLSLPILANH